MCVLGLGLIGGSLMRAGQAAGREVFGYNRSIDAVKCATADGFDATEDLTAALKRAALSEALIVLAVPVPALPIMLEHIRDTAPECPLTDVVSVKGNVLQQVQQYGLLERFVGGHPMAGTAHSGWAAGTANLFAGAPWVVSVDDHVDPHVWAQVMHLALDCRAVIVPARSDEHDAAAAAMIDASKVTTGLASLVVLIGLVTPVLPLVWAYRTDSFASFAVLSFLAVMCASSALGAAAAASPPRIAVSTPWSCIACSPAAVTPR